MIKAAEALYVNVKNAFIPPVLLLEGKKDPCNIILHLEKVNFSP